MIKYIKTYNIIHQCNGICILYSTTSCSCILVKSKFTYKWIMLQNVCTGNNAVHLLHRGLYRLSIYCTECVCALIGVYACTVCALV